MKKAAAFLANELLGAPGENNFVWPGSWQLHPGQQFVSINSVAPTLAAAAGGMLNLLRVLGAVESSFVMLAVFAALAAILSTIRDDASAEI